MLTGSFDKELLEKQIKEIIEYRERVIKQEEELIKKITDCFDTILKIIEKRKAELISYTYSYYSGDIEKLTAEEDRL